MEDFEQEQRNSAHEIQFVTSTIREAHVDKQWLKQFKEREDLEDVGFCALAGKFLRDSYRGIYIWSGSFVKLLSFRSGVNNQTIITTSVPYVLFVVGDLISTFLMLKHLVETYVNKDSFADQAQRLEWVFLLVYPLSSIVSPIFGLVALLQCRSSLYKQQTYWNCLSLFTNCLIYSVVKAIKTPKYEFIQLVGYILIAIKLCLSQLIPLQIAYFNNPKYQKNKEFLQNNYSSKK